MSDSILGKFKERMMKKIIILAVAILAINTTVFADGNAFTPLNFNDTSYGKSMSNITPESVNGITTLGDEAIGNGNIQNAISQLENAQVDIRNDLINLKTKYADIDAQYKLVKAERDTLKKQINSIERRIKDIDKAKERIRKNML